VKPIVVTDASPAAVPVSDRAGRRVFAAFLLIASVAVATVRLGPLPPFGHLVDPVYGVWAVARGAELPRTKRAHIPGLRATVDVRYDSRGVPHIFATSEEDAYRALGFVVARDRLFQIELQSRAGAGTLSELIGLTGVPMDRETRELGLPAAAQRAFAALDTGSSVAHVLRAYADGVNAWITQSGPGDLPIEYRLLDRRATPWSPIDAYHLLNRMSLVLAFNTVELTRLRIAAVVGDTVARTLIPLHSPLQQPIVPTANAGPHFLPAQLPPLRSGPPGHPVDSATLSANQPDPIVGDGPISEDGRGLGSDNWALAPRRTRSGFALLAGDPHLDLTLPSIWYEAHVVVPGQLDVAGVTITGGPAMVIGFTRDVAWTFTNTGADVLDLYSETVDDSVHPRAYRLDGIWRPLAIRVEQYRGPTGAVLATDTMLATHRGPLRRVDGRWLSMRWTALDAGAALPALLAIAHAHSTAEWLRAAAGYDVPAQNMLVADRSGSIAIRSTGRFPVRPGDGRGDVIRDGSTSASDWRGALAVEQYPTAIDPAQGYLASANQEPVDPSVPSSTGNVYLGADWPPPWRAIRINTLLRADSSATPDDMRRWQTDAGSARADFFLPYFLTAARSQDSLGRGSDSLRAAARLLSDWDGRYTRVNERAVLFEAAMRELARRVTGLAMLPPSSRRRAAVSSTVLAELLHDSSATWWSAVRVGLAGSSVAPRPGGPHHPSEAGPGARRPPSADRRDRDVVLAASLAAAYDSTCRRYGSPAGGGWRWDRVQHANIYHLLRIPAFSRLNLPIQGGTETLNPSAGAGTEGASWRMVVELGPEVHGWAVYPGGQSGNPVSSRYADRLPLWLSGSLDPVRVPHRVTDLVPQDVQSVLTLSPAR
jgi:penicillin G amidase